MSAIFVRGWIALGILVATPLVGFAQRGGNDADTYSENLYGDERPQSEPPRLFRGGLMHQLRSVTESVLGDDEAKDAVSEPNRNIPKPPPLGAQSSGNRNSTSARPNTRQNSSTNEQRGAAGAPNRSWAGQFLVPGVRERSQPTPPKPQTSNERSGDRRVYLGQRSGSPASGSAANGPITDPPRLSGSGTSNSGTSSTGPGKSSGGNSRGRTGESHEPPQRESFPAGELSLEASDAPASRDRAVEAQDAPAEVVVSHVPDVPYVPRKPLPKRDHASPTAGDADATPASKPKQPSNTSSSNRQTTSSGTSSANQSAVTPQQSQSLPALSALDAAPNDSPSVPSLDYSSIPDADASSHASKDAGSKSGSLEASLPSLDAPVFTDESTHSPASLSPSMPLPSLTTPTLPSHGAASSSSTAAGSKSPVSQAPSTPVPGTSLPSSPLPSSSSSGGAKSGVPSLNLPDASSTTSLPAAAAKSPASAATGTATTQSAPAASSAASFAPTESQERMRMEVPHVVVKLLGPGDLATGTPTAYELVVQNPDKIELGGLILRMETPPGVEIVKNAKWGDAVEIEKAPDGATLLMWNVTRVPAGGNAKLPLDLNATTSRNFAVAIEWTLVPQEGIDELSVKQADLQVALEGPVDVEKDIANVYRVRVSNPGSAAARNVKVQVGAASQQASQIEIGDLASGQSEVVEMDLTFEKAGRLEIGAHALADGNLKRNTNIVVNVRQAVLQASLSVPKSVLLGGNVFATMELRNSGDGAARKVQAGLMIPPEAEVINPPSGVTRQGDKLLWEVETVPPGQLVTVPIELRLSKPGNHAMKFACVTSSGALTSAEATTTVEAFADLKLQVNDPPAPAPIGAPVVYEMTVTNRGTRDARNVIILAQFSEGIEPQTATGPKNRVVPGQVLFDAIPAIPAGESVKIKVTAKASVPGMHRFRAEVRCEESDARLVEEESTRYLESASRIASPPSTLIQR